VEYAAVVTRILGPDGTDDNRRGAETRYHALYEDWEKGRTDRSIVSHELGRTIDGVLRIVARIKDAMVLRSVRSARDARLLHAFQQLELVRRLRSHIESSPDRTVDGLDALLKFLENASRAEVPKSSGARAQKPERGRAAHDDKLKQPKRAQWLKQELRARSLSKQDIERQGGPEHRTVQKILDGGPVREDVLEKLAKALSSKGGNKVSVIDIPQT
jgi:hypothetical protein